MKFDKLVPGQTLYDVHSYRMGNTTIRSMGCWEVTIISIDAVTRTAKASWNGNPPETFSERALAKLRAKEPTFVTGLFGSRRLLRRGEKPPAEATR